MVEFLKSVWQTKSVRRRYKKEFSVRCPIAVERWLEIAQSERSRDSLFPISFRKGEIGYRGKHGELASVFAGAQLGTWAIDSKTIDFIWERMDERHPKTIVEFGSGSSTCVFASWLKKNNPDGKIVSIDQNEWAAQETEERLKAFGLQGFVKLLVMKQGANDRYEVDLSLLGDALQGRKVDLVFSDGPAGVDGCRDNTLPAVLPVLADEAIWFLHDALRDGEMNICQTWGKINGISVEGIVPFGNGLAVGIWNNCRKVNA